MNAEQKRSIKSTVLECRNELEKDIEQVLISYGIYKDKEWVNVRSLKHLTEEEENIREKVEQVINKLEKGGFTKSKAVEEYIKEVSYTYLNRLAALRVMEVRGLIDEIIVSKSEYGNKSFIGNRFYEVAREYCKLRVDGGLAYLLNIMFEEISEEIKILFSMEDEYSFISPSSSTLLKIIDILCNKIDCETWKQDEIIGWIYQYFNDKEKADVFDRLYNKKQKFKIEDVPAATQLFTPDWIVEWIVSNSLGALWSDLKQGKVDGKKIEEIKVLDPCCGSGHFLVKAYDLLYKMYVEEGLYDKSEIPYKILENNIYGIDIDLRAIQLTGLILFIKTKAYLKNEGFDTNTKDKLTVNLACADVILLNGSRLESLKDKHKGNKTILKMIEIIYEEFKDVRLKGSLIQPEKKLFPLFEEYKHRAAKKELDASKRAKKKQAKGQVGFIEEQEITLSEYKSNRDFTKEEKELIDSLNAIYSEAVKANDINRQLFASEAVKSIKLVDIFMNQFDVILTNPPYMYQKNMNDKLKDFVNTYYSDSNNDLYSVFIKRCSEFIKDKGYIGMVTQHTFMFNVMFKKLRSYLLDNFILYKSGHLGTRAFGEISGEKVNTVMFVYKKELNDELRENSESQFFDLRSFKTEDEKKKNLKVAEEKSYLLSQKKFRLMGGSEFIYWIPNNILNLLNTGEKLDDKSNDPVMFSKKGLTTGENGRFLRFNWEIDERNYNNKWFPLSKGETDEYYYFEPKYIIDWENNGYDLKNFKNDKGKLRSAIRNEQFYFREGLTYTLLGGDNFKARYMEEGSIFEANGPCIFPNKISLKYAFGFLNSSLCKEILKYISPTIAINISDIDRIPFVYPKEDIRNKVESYSREIINISSEFTQFNELNKKFFDEPSIICYKDTSIEKSTEKYLLHKYLQEVKLSVINQNINELIYEVYELDEDTIKFIEENQNCINIQNIISKEDIEDYSDKEIVNFIDKTEFKIVNVDLEEIKNLILKKLKENKNIRDISIDTGISVFSIYRIIKNEVANIDNSKLVKDCVSYFIGSIFGRFNRTSGAIGEYLGESQGSDIEGKDIIPINSSIYLEEDAIEYIVILNKYLEKKMQIALWMK